MKADQRAAFFDHVARGHACTAAIAPRGAVYWRQHLPGVDLADMPQIVFKHALLCRHLCPRIQMLQAATATVAEVHTLRRNALRTFAQYRLHVGVFKTGLFAVDRRGNRFTGQRTFNENGFAVAARDATAFLVEGFYLVSLHLKNKSFATDFTD